MTETKRPILTLNRKKTDQAKPAQPLSRPEGPQEYRRRMQAEKEAREKQTAVNRTVARKPVKAPKPEQIRAQPLKPVKSVPRVKYARFGPAEEGVQVLKPWWPALFEDAETKLLQVGIHDSLFRDAESRGIALSRKQICRALKAVTRAEAYLSSVQAGAMRHDLHGQPVTPVTEEEARFSAERLERLRKQNRYQEG